MRVHHRNIRTIGNLIYDNRELLTVINDLLSSGYEWRVIKEIRERAGVSGNHSLWDKFSRIGVIDGYFETKHNYSTHYIRIANGSIDKVQSIVDYVVKE